MGLREALLEAPDLRAQHAARLHHAPPLAGAGYAPRPEGSKALHLRGKVHRSTPAAPAGNPAYRRRPCAARCNIFCILRRHRRRRQRHDAVLVQHAGHGRLKDGAHEHELPLGLPRRGAADGWLRAARVAPAHRRPRAIEYGRGAVTIQIPAAFTAPGDAEVRVRVGPGGTADVKAQEDDVTEFDAVPHEELDGREALLMPQAQARRAGGPAQVRRYDLRERCGAALLGARERV
mmetsp:Transcript_27567/g.87286  ORF Transcript_27567/g.87286 Transcript_27567/m.87286 type:complete len:234 (+) Transcript_27567:666-1367(+)